MKASFWLLLEIIVLGVLITQSMVSHFSVAFIYLFIHYYISS